MCTAVDRFAPLAYRLKSRSRSLPGAELQHYICHVGSRYSLLPLCRLYGFPFLVWWNSVLRHAGILQRQIRESCSEKMKISERQPLDTEAETARETTLSRQLIDARLLKIQIQKHSRSTSRVEILARRAQPAPAE